MPTPARTPPPPPSDQPASVTTAAIVGMVGKGMSVREIVELLPELTPAEVRAAMLRAANVVTDDDASLRSDDPVGRIIAAAQSSAGLTEEDALELAIEETCNARAERTERGR